MKYLSKIYRLIAAVLMVGTIFGCAEVQEPDYREKDYGYIQFKVYKSASYPTKAEPTIQYLGDIAKVRLEMKSSEGFEISQTLVLAASSEVAAEFGLEVKNSCCLQIHIRSVSMNCMANLMNWWRHVFQQKAMISLRLYLEACLYMTFWQMLSKEDL